MKNKLKYLIGISLKRKIATKWFVAANLLICLAVVSVINIDSIINFFGGDFNEKQTIYVVDKTDVAYDMFVDQMKLNSMGEDKKEEESKYIFKKIDKSEKEAKAYAKKNKKNIVLIFDKDVEKVLSVKLISKEYIDLMENQVLNNSIYNTKVMLAISQSNVSMQEIAKIYEQVKVDRVVLDEGKNSEDEGMEIIMSTVFPMFIFPFFMLIIFLVQMIGAEVNDEKTTRGMEIIISNVSPSTHFFSKVIAGNVFVILQGLLLIVSGGIGLLVRKLVGGDQISNGVVDGFVEMLKKALSTDFASKLVYVIPIILVLMLLTFLAYSILAGVLASMTTNIEDFQQLQTPIMIILLVGYYLAMMAGMFKGSSFIIGLSFVPLISAILAPSLFMLGQITIYHLFISIAIMVITDFLLIKYGLKIYKVGILNYSSSKLWKKMVKAAVKE